MLTWLIKSLTNSPHTLRSRRYIMESYWIAANIRLSFLYLNIKILNFLIKRTLSHNVLRLASATMRVS